MTRPIKRHHRVASTPALQRYWTVSKRPLQVLVFLLPLVVAYELGLAFVLQPEDITNLAHKRLLQFFHLFGVGGLYLGGVAVLVVLGIWHVLAREPWRIEWRALGIMAVESVALAMPLLVLAQAIWQLGGVGDGVVAAAATGAGADRLTSLGPVARMTVAIGAGLYEEFLFRMLIIALLHTLLVDVGKAGPRLGAAIAVAVSAMLFMGYHFLGDSGAKPSAAAAAFFLLAGLYFGVIYVLRGFGLVVGVHAAYDIITLSITQAA